MQKNDNKWVGAAAQVSSIGLLVLISTMIGLGIGLWLDGKLGTKPWLTFIFTILGLAAGFYEAIRMLLKVVKDEEDDGDR